MAASAEPPSMGAAGAAGPATSKQESKRGVRIRVLLTTASAGLICLAVGTVLFFDARSALLNTRQLVAENTAQVVDSVFETVRRHLDDAKAQVQSLERMVQQGRLSLSDETAMALALESTLAGAPQVKSVGFVASSMSFLEAMRSDERVLLYRQTHTADENVRHGLMAARASMEAFWLNPIYIGAPVNDIALYVVMPVRIEEEFLGAFFAAVGVNELSSFLSRIGRQHRAVPFILAAEQVVIGHPELTHWFEQARATGDMPLLEDLTDPVLKVVAAEQSSAWRPVASELVPAGFQAGIVDQEDGGQSIVVYTHVFGISALPWLVGAHFSTDDFQTYFGRITHTIIGGVVVLVVAIAAALFVSVMISRPVLRLVAAANELREKGPKDSTPVPPSSVFEFNTAASAFNQMVEGLRERETIRETFGKYVPESIAAPLVKHGGVLKPHTKLATVLFTDIQGFSTVAEKLSPEELISTLNEYFSVVLTPVEKYGGVIHQFQGDAILATYNLPLDDADHAVHAIKSAVELQEALAGRTFGPGVSLPTRVGINTGVMVGGTVGAGDRLGYTVHGDDVNVAARIEELNKRFGTYILIAASTMELAKDHFDFEPIGEVPIRGREGSTQVYRLVGEKGAG